MDLCDALQTAVNRHSGEMAQRTCVASVLSTLGHTEAPQSIRATMDGKPVRIHVWKGSPAGDVALVDGIVCLAEQLIASAGGKVTIGAKVGAAPMDRKELSRILGAPGWSKGGKTTASRLTPEQRKARAHRAAITRWWRMDQALTAKAQAAKQQKKKKGSKPPVQ